MGDEGKRERLMTVVHVRTHPEYTEVMFAEFGAHLSAAARHPGILRNAPQAPESGGLRSAGPRALKSAEWRVDRARRLKALYFLVPEERGERAKSPVPSEKSNSHLN